MSQTVSNITGLVSGKLETGNHSFLHVFTPKYWGVPLNFPLNQSAENTQKIAGHYEPCKGPNMANRRLAMIGLTIYIHTPYSSMFTTLYPQFTICKYKQ